VRARENGQPTDQITTRYWGRYAPSSETRFVLRGGPLTTTGGIAVDGRFKIVEATGRFAGIRGGGTIWLQLTCYSARLRRSLPPRAAE
jgi:hypothetical protein